MSCVVATVRSSIKSYGHRVRTRRCMYNKCQNIYDRCIISLRDGTLARSSLLRPALRRRSASSLLVKTFPTRPNWIPVDSTPAVDLRREEAHISSSPFFEGRRRVNDTAAGAARRMNNGIGTTAQLLAAGCHAGPMYQAT